MTKVNEPETTIIILSKSGGDGAGGSLKVIYPSEFIIIADTYVPGYPDRSVGINLNTPPSDTEIVIDWGDGNTETYTSLNAPNIYTHVYDLDGIYTVQISGNGFKGINSLFSGFAGETANRWVEIKNWGDAEWDDLDLSRFKGTITANDTPNSVNLYQMISFRFGTLIGNLDCRGWDFQNGVTISTSFDRMNNCDGVIDLSGKIKADVVGSTYNANFFIFEGDAAANITGMYLKTDYPTYTIVMDNFCANNSRMHLSGTNWASTVVDGAPSFKDCFRNTQIDPDISNWNAATLEAGTDSNNCFLNSGLTDGTYNKILIAWAQLPLQSGVQMYFPAEPTDAAGVAAKATIRAKGWIVNDLTGV